MAIPASAALLGLLLRNAYSAPNEPPSPAPTLIDVIVAAALALLSQKGLSRWAPELLLPHWAPTQGGIWGLEFLVVVRHVLPPAARQSDQPGQPISLQELRWRLEGFDERFRQLCKAHVVAAAFLVPASLLLICTGASTRARAGAALVFGGASILSILILPPWAPSETGDKACMDADCSLCCKELKRQRARLHWIQVWYFASLIPGIVLILWGSRVYSFLFLLPVLLFARLVDLEATKRMQEAKEIEKTVCIGAHLPPATANSI